MFIERAAPIQRVHHSMSALHKVWEASRAIKAMIENQTGMVFLRHTMPRVRSYFEGKVTELTD